MKKFIFAFVSIIILLGVFNTATFAAEEYVIATAEDFVNYISGVNNGTIQTGAVLNADIDLGKADLQPLCGSLLLFTLAGAGASAKAQHHHQCQ